MKSREFRARLRNVPRPRAAGLCAAMLPRPESFFTVWRGFCTATGIRSSQSRGDTQEDVMADRSELSVLNHLVETCRDGEHGFRFAAERANDPDARTLFAALAAERARFAEALAPHVHRLGGQALAAGTTAGTIHRGWMTLVNAVSRHHDDVLIAEAERGERAALHAYEDALQGLLPPTVTELIEGQQAAIRDAYDRIVALARERQLGV
jgi:uncharacterized protein (TIGR02284 family)